jgi:glycosyltransferase involved in cell wall biosynthesis
VRKRGEALKKNDLIDLKEGVSVISLCLNNEANVGEMLSTLVSNIRPPDQIIIVEGGSTDRTREIAMKYTPEVYTTEAGFANQLMTALAKIKYRYLLFVECDHRYPKIFVGSILEELKNSDYVGLQGTLVCDYDTNYIEKGMQVFYQIHQLHKGKKDVLGGPCIFYSKHFIDAASKTREVGYAVDTQVAELLKAAGFKLGLGHTTAFHHQPLSFKGFRRKMFNYGRGDYMFYKVNHKHWSARRRLKSIFHVFNRYMVDYSIKSIKIGKPQYVPFFWMITLFRYYGWAYTLLKDIFK